MTVLVATAGFGAPLIVGINPYSPPFEYLDQHGEPAGFDVDLIKAVADEAGLAITFQAGPRRDIRAGLESGRIGVAAGVLYSEDWAKTVDFSAGYLVLHYAIFVRKGTPWIGSLEALRGRRLVVERGSWIQDQLVAMGLAKSLTPVDSQADALERLAEGGQDAAVMPRLMGLELIRNRKLTNLQPVGPSLFTRELCFAVPRGQGELLESLESGLAQLNQTGGYFPIYDKWFGHMDPEAGAALRNLRRAGWVALGAGLLAALMLAWSWTLRRQVRQRTEALRQAMEAIRANELDLEQSRESLAKAQAMAAIGNWEWETATGVVRWSDQMYRILGWEPGAVPPSLRLIMARTHPADRPALGRALRRLLMGREVPPMDFRAVLEDGSPRFFHSLLELEPGPGGRARRVRGTLQDVTDLRNTEEALRQAQKLESLGVLAGGIAHDFNNLLSAIGGNLELAQMNMQPEPAAAPFLVKIEKILKRASELTHQMLAYSGKGRLVVKKLSLNQIAEEMPHLLEVSISKRVVLDYRFAPDLPLIEADATQLQQVIMNLVTNASESIGDRDGTITLTTGVEYLANPQEQVESHGWSLAPGTYITLEVADTGCGMSPETRRRLFDPFFTTKFSGRGLGLSAMLGILKGHNAGIRIRSREGEGSCFKLYFPACAANEPPPAPAPLAQPARAASGNILLVDDEPDILEATTELLTSMDFKVVPARDGLEAVELFQASPGSFSLVLMDLTMPRMDGREAFHLMRAREPGLKVVLCSGFNEMDVAKDFPYTSLSGFLQKPYTFQMLKDVVQQALA